MGRRAQKVLRDYIHYCVGCSAVSIFVHCVLVAKLLICDGIRKNVRRNSTTRIRAIIHVVKIARI